MSKMYVSKKFSFDAAHKLPNYQGKCVNLHGHHWVLNVTVSGQINKQTGMIIDFVRFKGIIEHEFISKLDHTYLNDIFPYPTAELIIEHLAFNIPPHFAHLGVTLEKLELWESEGSKVTWEK